MFEKKKMKYGVSIYLMEIGLAYHILEYNFVAKPIIINGPITDKWTQNHKWWRRFELKAFYAFLQWIWNLKTWLRGLSWMIVWFISHFYFPLSKLLIFMFLRICDVCLLFPLLFLIFLNLFTAICWLDTFITHFYCFYFSPIMVPVANNMQ